MVIYSGGICARKNCDGNMVFLSCLLMNQRIFEERWDLGVKVSI